MEGTLGSKHPQTAVPVNDSYFPLTANESWIARCTGKFNIVTNSGKGTGTGFHIGNGYFLTAGHCVPQGFDKNGSNVTFETEYFSVFIKEVVVHGANHLDFAILKLSSNELPSPQLTLADPLSYVGEHVLITHHPRGEPMKLSRGVITLMDNDLNQLGLAESQKYFRYTPATMKGSSGAPIALENDKYIIGVHTKGDEAFQGHHAAVSIQKIHEYLKTLVNQQGQFVYPNGVLHFSAQVFAPAPPPPPHQNQVYGQNPNHVIFPERRAIPDIRGEILPPSNMPPPPASKFTKYN